jgi:glycosyltransferase involved in cell wall biosynthesis
VPDFAKATPQVEQLLSVGCQMFYRRPFPPPFLYRLARRFFPLPEYNRIQLWSAADGVDLVVISQGSIQDGLSWMEAARAKGLKYTVVVQGASELWWPDDNHADRLAIGYENAARTYFVSQANLNLCRYRFATPLHSSKVIRNPFNVRYDAKPPWPTDDRDVLSLACVGRLDGAGKGHDLLFQVLSLPHWRERSVRVSLVGTGVNERTLRRMVDNLRLTNVEFIGQQNNIEEIWSKHHALVLPSRFEGMPLVVVEAMLCGRVCIATDVGGNRELIRDGINGFLAKAPTVELLDEAMSRAWVARGHLQEMGNTAARDVRQWVSPDPVEDFVRELTSLLDSA